MIIGICGLGLIGGTMAKSIKKNTKHSVYGYDKNEAVINAAIDCNAIDKKLSGDTLSECDIVLIALYPDDTVSFVKNNIDDFKKNAFVSDLCGIKGFVCEALESYVKGKDFTYISAHPMAGIEKIGFENSDASIFDGATMIMTPFEYTGEAEIRTLSDFYLSVGFSNIQLSTPSAHDKIIAYTSQLAHIISNAYVKSPTALLHHGFSAGSYRDLTRVAKLNDKMWTELFFDNRDNLIEETDRLILRLCEYSDALKKFDREGMSELLKNGSILKEKIDKGDEDE